jgi:phospholipid-translocating ATPase
METRGHMNDREASTKIGKLDHEINSLSKLLFLFMLVLSFAIVALSGFRGNYAINFFRFMLLLSAIVPISLRVNLDLGKIYYKICIDNDDEIPNTIARTSTIPEELGRI